MFKTIRNSAVLAIVLLLVPNAYAKTEKEAFHDAMRKLWEDHVTWTRLYIVDAVAGSPDKDLTAKRLLDNQTDIGNAVAAYYGRGAGNKLTALLKDHILSRRASSRLRRAATTRRSRPRTNGGTTMLMKSRSFFTAPIRRTGRRRR